MSGDLQLYTQCVDFTMHTYPVCTLRMNCLEKFTLGPFQLSCGCVCTGEPCCLSKGFLRSHFTDVHLKKGTNIQDAAWINEKCSQTVQRLVLRCTSVQVVDSLTLTGRREVKVSQYWFQDTSYLPAEGVHHDLTSLSAAQI